MSSIQYRLIYLFFCFTFIIKVESLKVENYLWNDVGQIHFCIKSSSQNVTGSFERSGLNYFHCYRNNISCGDLTYYYCVLPCDFKEKNLKISDSIINLQPKISPSFTIQQKVDAVYHHNSEVKLKPKKNVTTNGLSVKFDNTSLVQCSNIKINIDSIICRTDLSRIIHYNKINANISVEYGTCGQTLFVGTISVRRFPPSELLFRKYYWVLIILSVLLLTVCFYVIFKIYRRQAVNTKSVHDKQLIEMEIKIIKTQKKAFLEYQTAVKSFPDLGSLNVRHVLSFNNFISRTFNVEFRTESLSKTEYITDEFEQLILNRDKLIIWIERIEKVSKSQQRNLIASLLTIVLFQHPEYFLEILESLLVKYIKHMKVNSEEKILFRRSEAIVEKLVGNWITLCMYKSLKSGEIGKRFFNLYRAIKCKMNQGIVDCVTNKAKYAMTFDHIMLGDIDYEILNIKADVEVNLKMMDCLSSPLLIKMKNLDVQVLSLDSISQVKEKILDKAKMTFLEKEDIDGTGGNGDLCVGVNELNEFTLHLVNKTVKIKLDDYDRTSATLDKEYTIVNTMKHYNMKSDSRFLLISSTLEDNCHIESLTQTVLLNKSLSKVHLQFTQDCQLAHTGLQKHQTNENHSKQFFNPVIEDVNKEAYLMLLLATKKSILTFIEGFFQCIFNWNPNKINEASSDSLFEESERNGLNSSLNTCNADQVTKDTYLTPVYYLFSLLDKIALNLDIDDKSVVSVWKSNSFILRFWVNLIKNPNFIFSVDKVGPIDGSLTTIASVLMESCSVSSGNTLVDVNLPIVKQLFIEEVKEYSVWWRSFTESGKIFDGESVLEMMKDIVETYNMARNYQSSLVSLLAIANTLLPKEDVLEKS